VCAYTPLLTSDLASCVQENSFSRPFIVVGVAAHIVHISMARRIRACACRLWADSSKDILDGRRAWWRRAALLLGTWRVSLNTWSRKRHFCRGELARRGGGDAPQRQHMTAWRATRRTRWTRDAYLAFARLCYHSSYIKTHRSFAPPTEDNISVGRADVDVS